MRMKGRMRPYLPELTIRDYNIYLRYLRGVRRQLYEAYGLYSCHLLRSNGVLFAILSDSLAGRQATCQRKRVPGTLAWRRLMCQTQGIRLAAQVEVLLGWHNLQDRKYSELRPPRAGPGSAAPCLRAGRAAEPGPGTPVRAGAGPGRGADEPERQELLSCR